MKKILGFFKAWEEATEDNSLLCTLWMTFVAPFLILSIVAVLVGIGCVYFFLFVGILKFVIWLV